MTEKTKARIHNLKSSIKETLFMMWVCILIGMATGITMFILKKVFD
nr:MAG TPA: hypothetical protein [Caudoviricetes sp.]